MRTAYDLTESDIHAAIANWGLPDDADPKDWEVVLRVDPKYVGRQERPSGFSVTATLREKAHTPNG